MILRSVNIVASLLKRKKIILLVMLTTVESFRTLASPPADRGAEIDCPSAVPGKTAHRSSDFHKRESTQLYKAGWEETTRNQISREDSLSGEASLSG